MSVPSRRSWRRGTIPGAGERFTAMMRAAVTDPAHARPAERVHEPGGPGEGGRGAWGTGNAKLRAQLAVSLLLGLTLSRDILELPALVKARNPALAKSLGRAMQAHLVDPW